MWKHAQMSQESWVVTETRRSHRNAQPRDPERNKTDYKMIEWMIVLFLLRLQLPEVVRNISSFISKHKKIKVNFSHFVMKVNASKRWLLGKFRKTFFQENNKSTSWKNLKTNWYGCFEPFTFISTENVHFRRSHFWRMMKARLFWGQTVA